MDSQKAEIVLTIYLQQQKFAEKYLVKKYIYTTYQTLNKCMIDWIEVSLEGATSKWWEGNYTGIL